MSEATVSHGVVTLSIGGDGPGAPGGGLPEAGDPRVPSGTSVQQVAALYAVRTPPNEVAAIFESLRAIGAIVAEVSIR